MASESTQPTIVVARQRDGRDFMCPLVGCCFSHPDPRDLMAHLKDKECHPYFHPIGAPVEFVTFCPNAMCIKTGHHGVIGEDKLSGMQLHSFYQTVCSVSAYVHCTGHMIVQNICSYGLPRLVLHCPDPHDVGGMRQVGFVKLHNLAQKSPQ